MDLQKRTEILTAKKAELLDSLEQHVSNLETLDRTTSFDFDIATDLSPALIDNTTKEGRDRLRFWQNIYTGLADAPQYTVVKRYSTDLEDGCYGFGQEPTYRISDAWVRIYKNLQPDAIKFSRDGDGNPQVIIDQPSFLLPVDKRRNRETEPSSETPLFMGMRKASDNVLAISHIEHLQEPKVFFYPDLSELQMHSLDYSYSGTENKYLGVKLGAFVKMEKEDASVSF